MSQELVARKLFKLDKTVPEMHKVRTDRLGVFSRTEEALVAIESVIDKSSLLDVGIWRGQAWLGGISLLGMAIGVSCGYVTQVERPVKKCLSLEDKNEEKLIRWSNFKTESDKLLEEEEISYTWMRVALRMKEMVELASGAWNKSSGKDLEVDEAVLKVLAQTELVLGAVFEKNGANAWIKNILDLPREAKLRDESLAERFKQLGWLGQGRQ